MCKIVHGVLENTSCSMGYTGLTSVKNDPLTLLKNSGGIQL